MTSPDLIRLADELHDGVIQELAALLLQIQTYRHHLTQDPQAAQADLDQIERQTRLALQQLRRLAGRLRTPIKNGS